MIRREDLGKYAFVEAVKPAQRIIDLFNTLPSSHLRFFPDEQLVSVRNSANSFYNLLDSFNNFDVASAEPNVADARNDLLSRLSAQFQPTFNVLAPLVSFATSMAQDFQALEREARAATQAAKDQAAGILEELSTQKKIVDSIITEVRSAAAEQGVGKQAIHFKNEADNHAALSTKWLERTVTAAIILIVYSIISLFIHRIDGIADGDYAMFQLAVSKILIFAVLAYGVILSARNFLSHKHNEIINRHRQNALATFTALAEATSDAASSDIVLSHAAACIFAPQETGYTKSDSVHTEGVPALQILPRIGAATGSSS